MKSGPAISAVGPITVAEYSPNLIKKSVVGTGHAQKAQVAMMVTTLLPSAGPVDGDAADALAVAICHAHLRRNRQIIAAAEIGAGKKPTQNHVRLKRGVGA